MCRWPGPMVQGTVLSSGRSVVPGVHLCQLWNNSPMWSIHIYSVFCEHNSGRDDACTYLLRTITRVLRMKPAQMQQSQQGRDRLLDPARPESHTPQIQGTHKTTTLLSTLSSWVLVTWGWEVPMHLKHHSRQSWVITSSLECTWTLSTLGYISVNSLTVVVPWVAAVFVEDEAFLTPCALLSWVWLSSWHLYGNGWMNYNGKVVTWRAVF
jgi:hypothetical protein